MDPLVTICLPNLNKASFLPERLASISNQTYANWECIVHDSESDDGSYEILQEWAQSEPRVSLHSIPRLGIYPSWNEGLALAKGKYVYIATSDDSMSPNCLATAVAAMEQTPQAEWCHFPVEMIDENSQPIGDPIKNAPASGYYGDWMRKAHLRSGRKESQRMLCLGSVYLSVTGMFFRNSDRLRFPSEFGELGDFFFYLNEVRDKTVLYLPHALAHWRIYADQATRPASERMRKQLSFLSQYEDADLGRSEPEFAKFLQLRRYLCDQKIFRDQYGKFAASARLLSSKYGRQELVLRAKGVPNAEHYLARNLVDRDDLTPIELELPSTR